MQIIIFYQATGSTILQPLLNFIFKKAQKGAGFWKINNSHLLNEDLKQAIKNEIILIVQTYACTLYHPDFVKNYQIYDIDIMIDIKLFWDIIHTQIRGLLISYAGKKK